MINGLAQKATHNCVCMACSTSIGSEGQQMVKLQSSEGTQFEVKEEVALQSGLLKNVLNFTFCAPNPNSSLHEAIPIHNHFNGADGVTAATLGKVLDYCLTDHQVDPTHAKEKRIMQGKETWTAQERAFVEGLGEGGVGTMLFNVIMAADYMEVQGLLDLGCDAVADMIRGKSVEEIRQLFHIHNDLAPDEEEAERAANSWAFEDSP